MTHKILKDFLANPLEIDEFKEEEFYDTTFKHNDDLLAKFNELMDTDYRRLFVEHQVIEDGHLVIDAEKINSMGVPFYVVTGKGKVLYFFISEDLDVYTPTQD